MHATGIDLPQTEGINTARSFPASPILSSPLVLDPQRILQILQPRFPAFANLQDNDFAATDGDCYWFGAGHVCLPPLMLLNGSTDTWSLEERRLLFVLPRMAMTSASMVRHPYITYPPPQS